MYTQDELLYLECKEKYYNGEVSDLTDPQYDALEQKLKSDGSNVIYIVGTQKIISKEDKHIHPTAMLSLEKVQVINDNNLYEEESFFNKIIPWMQKSDMIELTSKFDGNAISCIYKNGVLNKVLTRGDGEKGVDKINKMKYHIPNTISDKASVVEIRGEALLRLSTFNDKYVEEGKVQNARNVLAGLLGKDDLDINKAMDISIATYSYTRLINNKKEFAHNTMLDLDILGFNKQNPIKTIYIETLNKTRDELIEVFKKAYYEFKDYRENDSDFLLDGIVMKYQEGDRLEHGETSHHPRWALSIKFETEKVATKILGIDWFVGTTGELTPVALLEPIELLGTIVKKASLYNLGKIIENGTWPGAEVLIRKSGEIIPQVVTVLKRAPEEEQYLSQYNQMREKLT